MEPYCAVQRVAGRHGERAASAGAGDRPGGRVRAGQHPAPREVHQGQPGSLHRQGLQKGEGLTVYLICRYRYKKW